MKDTELRKFEEELKKYNTYIASSIEGKGTHIGRFRGLSLDANGDIIILCDIDKDSVTKHM